MIDKYNFFQNQNCNTFDRQPKKASYIKRVIIFNGFAKSVFRVSGDWQKIAIFDGLMKLCVKRHNFDK